MKILFVTPMLCYPGVPYAGEASIFKLMESLSLRGHKVSIISGLRPGDEEHISKLEGTCEVLEAIPVPWGRQEVCNDVFKWILGGFRGGLSFRKKAALAVQRHSRKEGFDIIQVEHTDLGAFIERPEGKTPIIMSAVDVLFKPLFRKYRFATGIRRGLAFLRYTRTKKKELETYRRFDSVFTWSEYDKELLLKECSDLNVFVTSPFINIKREKTLSVERDPSSLLFSGAMNRPDNITACLFLYREIFKRVKREIKEIKLYIVGNAPPESIKALASEDGGVVVTGYVKSMEPFFATATVFVSPIFFGGGIIVKNLEAMARGVPVVTTPIGNEGGGAAPDREVLTAEGGEEFSRKIIRLIRERRHREDISRNGTLFVEEKFSWNQTVDRVEGEYRRLTEKFA